MKGIVHKRGVTLVEIAIGIAIFAGIGTMFIMFLRASSREMRFSGDHFNAMVLSQKVTEDILEEFMVNPYALDSLAISDSASGFQEVVDSESVFFSFIEDRAEPRGRINPSVDGGITSQMQPMYDSVKNFRFKTTGRRLAASGDHEDRNLVDAGVNFFWSSDMGKGEYGNRAMFFSPATMRKTDLDLAVDEATVDARIPAEVFYRPTETLPAIAAATGENEPALRALGRISLISRDFAGSNYFATRQNEIRQLATRLSGTPTTDLEGQYELRKIIAEKWYDLARSSFQVLHYLEPEFAILQAQGRFDTSMGTGFNPLTFQQDLFNYRIIYEYFVGSIVQSRYYYYSMLTDTLMKYKGAKVQQQLIQRLIDIYRVTAIIPTRPGAMVEYRNFLHRIREFSENRNPFLHRMVQHELYLTRDENQSEWLEKFQNLKRIHQIIVERMPTILEFIRERTVGVIVGG